MYTHTVHTPYKLVETKMNASIQYLHGHWAVSIEQLSEPGEYQRVSSIWWIGIICLCESHRIISASARTTSYSRWLRCGIDNDAEVLLKTQFSSVIQPVIIQFRVYIFADQIDVCNSLFQNIAKFQWTNNVFAVSGWLNVWNANERCFFAQIYINDSTVDCW